MGNFLIACQRYREKPDEWKIPIGSMLTAKPIASRVTKFPLLQKIIKC